MSPKRQKYNTLKASLIIWLVFVLVSSCNHRLPVWYKNSITYHSPSKNDTIYYRQPLDTVYKVVENNPSYPGGQNAWIQHLKKSLKFPEKAVIKNMKGYVLLSFDVNKVGEIKNIRISRSLGYAFDQEAMRVLKASSPWLPASQNGEAVHAKSMIRIHFTQP